MPPERISHSAAVLLWAASKGMAIRQNNNAPEVTNAILGVVVQIEAVSARV